MLEQKASELASLNRQNAELALRARRLEAADPAVVEDLARRKLEMMKPGEVLFIAGSAAVPTSTSSRTTPVAPR